MKLNEGAIFTPPVFRARSLTSQYPDLCRGSGRMLNPFPLISVKHCYLSECQFPSPTVAAWWPDAPRGSATRCAHKHRSPERTSLPHQTRAGDEDLRFFVLTLPTAPGEKTEYFESWCRRTVPG